MDAAFIDNSAKSRFEYHVDGGIVIANYHRTPNLLSIDYVEAPPALRGTGAAGTLMEKIAQLAREEKTKIRPVCGYAASWLRRHPEYADLIS